MKSHRYIVGIFIIFSLLACQQQEAEQASEDIIRAVKLYTVVDSNAVENRVYPGQSSSSKVSDLSFPISGKIAEMLVAAGDKVVEDQTLAKLDKSSVVLEQQVAQAEFMKAKADFDEKASDYNRKMLLAEKGWITRTDLDKSEGSMKSAKQQMNVMLTKVNLAKKTVSDTVMKAPFSGTIGERVVELYEEVSTGQKVLTIDGAKGIEIKIDVPERELSMITIGIPARVKFNAIDKIFVAQVTEIGSSAGPGNLFEVKVSLIDIDEELRSGLSAEVTLNVNKHHTTQKSYLIPLTSMLAGKGEVKAYVYVYNSESSSLEKRAIAPVDRVIGNFIAVSGVNTGESIVSAGVSFLTDGLKVKPYQAQ
ncbi:MAG: hypothetical protein COB23_06900 [Methylophaga sp.]|nr:MAG: hypothetical protein COB23_06900 [Methylophaga sp.]